MNRDGKITAILNVYKRPEYLKEQITALENQTIKPDDIMIWYNKPEDGEVYDLSSFGYKVATNNSNFKFHGRFAFGLLAKTEYVAFFDDDTIPGVKWFENCLNEIKKENLILGSAGILLKEDRYNPHQKIGWNGINNSDLTYVDLVGHAWFMKYSSLNYLWREEQISWHNGEDIQLSSRAYRLGGIKTATPPHPREDTSMWGSTSGMIKGNDDKASWKLSNHNTLRDKIVTETIDQGYIRVLKR